MLRIKISIVETSFLRYCCTASKTWSVLNILCLQPLKTTNTREKNWSLIFKLYCQQNLSTVKLQHFTLKREILLENLLWQKDHFKIAFCLPNTGNYTEKKSPSHQDILIKIPFSKYFTNLTRFGIRGRT